MDNFKGVESLLVKHHRLCVYTLSSIVFVILSYFLGKEMLWDTMYYHVYAGFSALHNRFSKDFFAAGAQGYFNPYAYVPFYLITRSALTPLEGASLLALLQSGIAWICYEIALLIVPASENTVRVKIAVLATVFALASSILINEIGSSFSDITTAEIALSGWLVLLHSIRYPRVQRVALGSVLLGIAIALKPTNAVHALAAICVIILIPRGWRHKALYLFTYAVSIVLGFALASLPWAYELYTHFGNPVFPLLNGLFKSPYFTKSSLIDHRFIPGSMLMGLWRPFEIIIPKAYIYYELAAPDLRYGALFLLLIAGTAVLIRSRAASLEGDPQPQKRMVLALCSGFVLDWTLWLVASGNGRYFMPMACIAGILCVVLPFWLLARYPRTRLYGLLVLFTVQALQLSYGAEYRKPLPWTEGSWYEVSVPSSLKRTGYLYLDIGAQSNSLIIPSFPRSSAFVNLGSLFDESPGTPGAHRIESLVNAYYPRIELLMVDKRTDAREHIKLVDRSEAEDALMPYGLKALPGQCRKITVRGVSITYRISVASSKSAAALANTEYIAACPVVRGLRVTHFKGQRRADRVFRHMESACPSLLIPRGLSDEVTGDSSNGYAFSREFTGTGIAVWVAHGSVYAQKIIGGADRFVGKERVLSKERSAVPCKML